MREELEHLKIYFDATLKITKLKELLRAEEKNKLGVIDGAELGMTDGTLDGRELDSADGLVERLGLKVSLMLGLLEIVGIEDLTTVGSVLGIDDASLVGTVDGLETGTAPGSVLGLIKDVSDGALLGAVIGLPLGNAGTPLGLMTAAGDRIDDGRLDRSDDGMMLSFIDGMMLDFIDGMILGFNDGLFE